MSKVFILELKRLVPLVLLLVLLAGLSLYDYMTPEAQETGFLDEQDNGEQASSNIEFTTEDEGYRSEPASFVLAEDTKEWHQILEEKNLGLARGSLNEKKEIGLFAFHSEIKEIRLLDGSKAQSKIEVIIEPKNDFYHVAIVNKKQFEEEVVNWRFVDDEGKALYQITQDN
ncbi:hypothetical protein [Natranaerobius trueperi]|uniref:Uncharacterized protein n=1 Tax=Natranaerobius trueperi TaxID=759412 RepID=A0A226BYA9_9FIRM|nr:hypothetical protein [Natranaerobius trueperi]OWZ83120.1 hypothetical protein CDO51_10140 [Natranaerobius trueperi]